jgi:hypothetical protein
MPGGREALRPLDPAQVVDDSGDMDVLVSVDPADHPAVLRLRDCGHATSSVVRVGWVARTAERADRTVIGASCTGASSVTDARRCVRSRPSLTRPTDHLQDTP